MVSNEPPCTLARKIPQTPELCYVCQKICFSTSPKYALGIDVEIYEIYEHYPDLAKLHHSANQGCSFCLLLWNGLCYSDWIYKHPNEIINADDFKHGPILLKHRKEMPDWSPFSFPGPFLKAHVWSDISRSMMFSILNTAGKINDPRQANLSNSDRYTSNFAREGQNL